jgi:sirohydrochlorin ferrochelatase
LKTQESPRRETRSRSGVTIAAGYLEGSESRLSEVLGDLRSQDGRPPAVVVPLLICPYPEVDEAIAAAVAEADVPILVAGHLGPHPFVAEAMHARLYEAGLARAGRSGRISIVSAADGFVVGAAGDAEAALQVAGVVAVLLASRLTIPAVPTLLDHATLRRAAENLQAAQVTRVVLAPCVIGPEVPAAAMAAITAETGLECAPPLGGYPTIGQLVAIRERGRGIGVVAVPERRRDHLPGVRGDAQRDGQVARQALSSPSTT